MTGMDADPKTLAATADRVGQDRNGYWYITWSLIGLAVACSLALRISGAWQLPLWLDESWTAVLSSAATFASFRWQMWLDSNAPLYYFLVWLWPFESNFGLRIPSLLFLAATAAVAAVWRHRDIPLGAAVFWAALLLLWHPDIGLFIDARYYSLLLLVSTAQTIAFLHALDSPCRKQASIWVGLGTLAVLTHYFAAVPAALQGIIYLVRHRRKAIRNWPALLLTLPALGWLIFHWPRLALYAHPDIAWYDRVTFTEVPGFFYWPLGGLYVGIAVLVLVFVFRRRRPLPESVQMLLWSVLATSVVMIAAGVVRPMLVTRYLIPIVPPVLLCVAVAVRRAGYLPIAAVMLLSISNPAGRIDIVRKHHRFGLESSAELLPNARVVAWMLDYGAAGIHDGPQMSAMLQDAFRRRGQHINARWGANELLSGDALILFYGREGHPPQQVERSGVIDKVKAEWSCREDEALTYRRLICSRPEPSPGPRALTSA